MAASRQKAPYNSECWVPTTIPNKALVVGFFRLRILLVEALMLLSEIIDDVVDTLRRPDLRNFVTTRVRQQVKLLHGMDNFPRDKVEQVITVQNPGIVVRSALPAFWRKFDSIMPIDSGGTRIKLMTDTVDFIGFREVDPRKTMGFHDCADTNYYYIAGDALNMKMQGAFTSLYTSFYKYPDLTSLNSATWITESFSEMATYRVLLICHRMLGNFDQAQDMDRLYEEARAYFIEDALYSGAL